jgi:hypothetical protein
LYFTNPYWLQYQLRDNDLSVARPTVESINKFADELLLTTTTAKTASVQSTIEIAKDPDTVPIPTTEKSTATILSGNMAIPTIEAVKEMMRKIDPVPPAENKPAEPVMEPADEYNDDIAPTLFGATESDNKIASLLSNQLADFKKPVEDDARLDIETSQEKLFMVDYFASQGIKIDLAAIPQDKLTTHLRKFTDWLKQVKQGELNPKDLLANIAMEQAVVQTAQISNKTEDILTEAMAEVLEKQGQSEKAIELYEKLSFLNPEKSSYFAAKIEQLKGI